LSASAFGIPGDAFRCNLQPFLEPWLSTGSRQCRCCPFQNVIEAVLGIKLVNIAFQQVWSTHEIPNLPTDAQAPSEHDRRLVALPVQMNWLLKETAFDRVSKRISY
jgi:hypothetical protein